MEHAQVDAGLKNATFEYSNQICIQIQIWQTDRCSNSKDVVKNEYSENVSLNWKWGQLQMKMSQIWPEQAVHPGSWAEEPI